MNAKILLIALSAAAFSSCSTAYKSGQTPDDVYYSPVRVVDERRDDKREETRQPETTADDARIRMQIRDYRWRDLNNEYDYNYSYNNSPYGYCTCACNSYGYYYNPYYYSRPVYSAKATYAVPINSTPRMVNLNSYKNYSSAVTNAKTGVVTNPDRPTRQYNNSNNGSKVGNIIREVFTPNSNTNSNSNNSSSNNNTRTYTPATNNSSGNSNSGSSSGGSSSGGSVSRPGRGG